MVAKVVIEEVARLSRCPREEEVIGARSSDSMSRPR
jgi:hypothetical protein